MCPQVEESMDLDTGGRILRTVECSTEKAVERDAARDGTGTICSGTCNPRKLPFSLGSDELEGDSCSSSAHDLVSVGSFNSLSSTSSSDEEDSTFQATTSHNSHGCFESLQQNEQQEEFHGSIQFKTFSGSCEARDSEEISYRHNVVTPAYWTDRQKLLAIQGPFSCPSVSSSEFLWWACVRARSMVPLCMIYCAQYYLTLALILPVLLMNWQQALLVYCGYATAYCFVIFRTPERSGRKASPRFQSWFGPLMQEVSALHFGGLRIIRDSVDSFSPEEKYIFGYHPHGMLPAILAWFPFTEAWRALFPSIHPVGLVATALFKVPVLRDLCLKAGIREVSRSTFANTLKEKRAVVMCPGGQSPASSATWLSQAEIAAHKHSSMKSVVLSARKTGFIRIALETGAKLVPMFLFGESQLLDNMVDLPEAQRFTYKVFGFPIPFIPVGFLGLLPIPRSGPVTLIVGRPMDPAEFTTTEELSPHDLERMRVAYYRHVERLFEKYKGKVGFSDWDLLVESK